MVWSARLRRKENDAPPKYRVPLLPAGDVANVECVRRTVAVEPREGDLGVFHLARDGVDSGVVGDVRRGAVVQLAIGINASEEGASTAKLFGFGHGLTVPAEDGGCTCTFAADVEVAVLPERGSI